MIQNHLLQLFALAAMEPPARMDADLLHNHKAEVLRAVRRIPHDAVDRFAVAGQYASGTIAGQPVPGYREEPGIGADSRTETFAAVKLFVDNYRWHGVPFYLRTGKRLAQDYAEIAVQLREVPQGLFGAGLNNWLVFEMKPHETIHLLTWGKKPGIGIATRPLVLSALYKKPDEEDYSAYEELLMDVLQGDHSAFPRFDEVEEAWKIVAPIMAAWQTASPDPYAAGSVGPTTQERLMEAGHQWRPLAETDSL
jgi:glucose-6-phosphate 1-dehydrogenase